MTEIKIEKKKPVWPWILLLLAIAALVYFLVFNEAENETEMELEEVESTSMIPTFDSNSTYILTV